MALSLTTKSLSWAMCDSEGTRRIISIVNSGSDSVTVKTIQCKIATVSGRCLQATTGASVIGDGSAFNAYLTSSLGGSAISDSVRIWRTITPQLQSNGNRTPVFSASDSQYNVTFTLNNEGRSISPGGSLDLHLRFTGYNDAATTGTGSVVGVSFEGFTENQIVPPAEYTISFNANGGSNPPSSIKRTSGTIIQVPAQGSMVAPTYSVSLNGNGGSGTSTVNVARRFQGWSKSSTGSVAYPPGASFGEDGNMTLYASWGTGTYTLSSTKPTYPLTVTFDPNGGTFNGTNTRTVYREFKGWVSDNTILNPGTSITLSSNVSYTASWGTAKIGTLPICENSSGNIIPRSNYRLDTSTPWTLTKNGGDSVTAQYEITTNTTVYAKWEYLVIFDSNGGQFHVSMPPGDYNWDYSGFNEQRLWKKYGQNIVCHYDIELDSSNPLGWGTSSTGSVIYQNSSSSYYTTNAPVRLYAIWSVKRFTVRFLCGWGDNTVISRVENVAYGSDIPQNLIPTYGKSIMTNGVVFRRPGSFVFVGWSGATSNICSNTDIVAMYDFAPVWICVRNSDGNNVWMPYKPEEN